MSSTQRHAHSPMQRPACCYHSPGGMGAPDDLAPDACTSTPSLPADPLQQGPTECTADTRLLHLPQPTAKPSTGGEEGGAAGGGKAAKAQRKAELKAAKAKEAKDRKMNSLKDETEGLSKAIKAGKSKIRALVEQGISNRQAVKIAAAAGKKGGKPAKKKARPAALFDGDGTGKPGGEGGGSGGGDGGGSGGGGGGGGVGGGKGKERGGGKAAMSKADLNKLKRKGKGVHAFKSKKKYKRR